MLPKMGPCKGETIFYIRDIVDEGFAQFFHQLFLWLDITVVKKRYGLALTNSVNYVLVATSSLNFYSIGVALLLQYA
jgi:hypothetical protein